MRLSPCTNHVELERFDSILRSGLSSILNTNITDIGWIQVSLPIGEGGLGIRSAALLAPSAFLASAASTQELQTRILQSCHIRTDDDIELTISTWRTRYGADEPSRNSAHKQSV